MALRQMGLGGDYASPLLPDMSAGMDSEPLMIESLGLGGTGGAPAGEPGAPQPTPDLYPGGLSPGLPFGGYPESTIERPSMMDYALESKGAGGAVSEYQAAVQKEAARRANAQAQDNLTSLRLLDPDQEGGPKYDEYFAFNENRTNEILKLKGDPTETLALAGSMEQAVQEGDEARIDAIREVHQKTVRQYQTNNMFIPQDDPEINRLTGYETYGTQKSQADLDMAKLELKNAKTQEARDAAQAKLDVAQEQADLEQKSFDLTRAKEGDWTPNGDPFIQDGVYVQKVVNDRGKVKVEKIGSGQPPMRVADQKQINYLRDRVDTQGKDFRIINDSNERIKAIGSKKATPASDLSLVFNFMKINDPGSVVRETEFKTAANAKAWLVEQEELGIVVPQPIADAIRKIATGNILENKQREDFLSTAKTLFQGGRDAYDTYISNVLQQGEIDGVSGEIVLGKERLAAFNVRLDDRSQRNAREVSETEEAQLPAGTYFRRPGSLELRRKK